MQMVYCTGLLNDKGKCDCWTMIAGEKLVETRDIVIKICFISFMWNFSCGLYGTWESSKYVAFSVESLPYNLKGISLMWTIMMLVYLLKEHHYLTACEKDCQPKIS